MKENDQKQSEVSPRGEMQGNGTSSNIQFFNFFFFLIF